MENYSIFSRLNKPRNMLSSKLTATQIEFFHERKIKVLELLKLLQCKGVVFKIEMR